MDRVVLQCIFSEKKPTYKWPHAVQSCVVQGSTVVAKIIKMNKIMYFGGYYIGSDPKVT